MKAKKNGQKGFLTLENGVPSSDSFKRVLYRISPQQFEASFVSWTEVVAEVCSGEIIAIDGKRLRLSYDSFSGKSAIHMVSAWAHDVRMILAQVKVGDKSNEITAIPELLEVLDIAGCIVTIDAMGCQTAIAQQIIDKEGDYPFGLKGNQGKTLEAVKEHFDTHPVPDESHTKATVDGGHGQIEYRIYKRFSTEEILDLKEWPGLKTVAMVESKTQNSKGDISSERRYYISSFPIDAARIDRAIRGFFWGGKLTSLGSRCANE